MSNRRLDKAAQVFAKHRGEGIVTRNFGAKGVLADKTGNSLTLREVSDGRRVKVDITGKTGPEIRGILRQLSDFEERKILSDRETYPEQPLHNLLLEIKYLYKLTNDESKTAEAKQSILKLAEEILTRNPDFKFPEYILEYLMVQSEFKEVLQSAKNINLKSTRLEDLWDAAYTLHNSGRSQHSDPLEPQIIANRTKYLAPDQKYEIPNRSSEQGLIMPESEMPGESYPSEYLVVQPTAQIDRAAPQS